MNYISRLQQENRHLGYNIKDAQAALNELCGYLLSPKFHNDTTVQVADVLRRLQPVRDALMQDKHDHLAAPETSREQAEVEQYGV